MALSPSGETDGRGDVAIGNDRPDPRATPCVARGMTENPSPLSTVQPARAALRFGNRVSLDAEVSLTPLGLLAIGGLVSAILLSVPPIVRAAGKAARARRKAARGDRSAASG